MKEESIIKAKGKARQGKARYGKARQRYGMYGRDVDVNVSWGKVTA